jgi:transcriptional regulator with XRE-family HTH domain
MQLNGALKELSPQQAKELGRRLSARREELGLTVRDVERLAGVDDATVARLENGLIADPRPPTVRAICDALDLVVADVYPLADYPGSLPNFRPYLRTKYRGLPAEAVEQLDRIFRRLAERHGLDPAGPAPGEDALPEEETTKP